MISIILFCIFLLTVVRYVCVASDGAPQHATNLHDMNDKALPLYTLLVPMFMEKISDIRQCRKNILSTYYRNIEVIYLCEEVDTLATGYLSRNIQRSKERVVIVPRVTPLTKPKACNYGLEFARGRYVVVYDVEDLPHRMQLHVSHRFFNYGGTRCIQFPLEFVCTGAL